MKCCWGPREGAGDELVVIAVVVVSVVGILEGGRLWGWRDGEEKAEGGVEPKVGFIAEVDAEVEIEVDPLEITVDNGVELEGDAVVVDIEFVEVAADLRRTCGRGGLLDLGGWDGGGGWVGGGSGGDDCCCWCCARSGEESVCGMLLLGGLCARREGGGGCVLAAGMAGAEVEA